MKKINLNKDNLKLKKLQLMKSNVANLTNENMMQVLGGGTAYVSCAQQNGCQGTGTIPTSALASCPTICRDTTCDCVTFYGGC